MRKKAYIGMMALLVLGSMIFLGCSNDEKATTDGSKTGEEQVYKIGICQLIEHPALDAAYEGFVDGLADAGYIDGVNIELDRNNAQGDQSNAVTIASKLVNNNSDLILAIATPAAQAVANATKDIPILVTAVTDPAGAGIVETNEAPGGNVTGTSDMTPIAEQIGLFTELLPEVKKIAIMYCSSEMNSEIQAKIATQAAKELGIEVQIATVSGTNEIQQVTQSLVGKVDAIFIPTDNMLTDGMATVSLVATENGIPIICSEGGGVSLGALATRGISYYELGKQTAEMAVKILKGEAEAATMPIEYSNKVSFTYNKEIAEALGIIIPEDFE
jgi:ABC-type uncharacterized transport system, periplasmic component